LILKLVFFFFTKNTSKQKPKKVNHMLLQQLFYWVSLTQAKISAYWGLLIKVKDILEGNCGDMKERKRYIVESASTLKCE